MTLKDCITRLQAEKDRVTNGIEKTVDLYFRKIKQELDEAGINYVVENGAGNGKAYRFTVVDKRGNARFEFELNYPYIHFNNNKYNMDEEMFNVFRHDLAKRIVL